MGNSNKRQNNYNSSDLDDTINSNNSNNQLDYKFPLYNDMNYFENNEPTAIASYLFLGGSFGNRNPTILKHLGITHVLNMAVELQPHFELVSNKRFFKHKHIMADDTVHYNLRYHFEDAFQFIDDAVKLNSKVLVHCMMGISRSGNFFDITNLFCF